MKHTQKKIILFLLLGSFFSFSKGQDPSFEEIFVYVRVEGVGGFDVDALYEYETNQLYLPVPDLFRFLQIKYEISPQNDSLSGFFVMEDRFYLIDFVQKEIHYQGKIIPLRDSQITRSDVNLYLSTGVFGDVFGLHTTFHFNSLSVEVKPEIELPVIREMRLKQFRSRVDRFGSEGDVEADTTLDRRYHFFRFGMVDWAVNATQYSRSANDLRGSFAIGAELLGGETNLVLNYSTRDGFNTRNQQYRWRWANNQSPLFRQVRLGKINPQTVASIYDPLSGFQITNAPTAYRRSFGSYTLSNYTEPEWSVELYVNNTLVDYQTADASGFYSFEIPMVYGSSEIQLKFYGPYGEERSEKETINVPFSFLPKGELEYTVSGGIVSDNLHSYFGRAEVLYGINRFATLGGGMEYLSSIEDEKGIPFLSAQVTPLTNIFLEVEYAHGVRTNGILTYHPLWMMAEINYTRYVRGQKAIRFNYLEEREASLSLPVQFAFLRGNTRLSFKQNVYEKLTYNKTDMTFSTYVGKVNANLTSYANWVSGGKVLIYGNYGMGIRFGHGITLRSQSQFNFSNFAFIALNAHVEKRIARSGLVSLSYDENLMASSRSVSLSFRWDLSFAQTNFSTRIGTDEISANQGLRGSLAFGTGKGYVHATNRSAIGRGGLTIIPFIDLNHNAIKEKEEPLTPNVNTRISGGRMLEHTGDSLIRVTELEPYRSYVLTLDESSLEQISWQLNEKSLRIFIDPNQFKKVYIPVLPMGEVNGMVFLEEERGIAGQDRIVVNFFHEDGSLVHSTMSETGGYFTFLGLPPGKYLAEVDKTQLERLLFTAEPEKITFEIKPSYYGDIVDDLEFILRKTTDTERKE
jgi:hypothetical protein